MFNGRLPVNEKEFALRPQSGGRRISGTYRHSHLEDESVEFSGFEAGDGAEAAGFEFKHWFNTAVRFMHGSS